MGPTLSRRAVLGGLGAAAFAHTAAAGAWPERPITLGHGFAAGIQRLGSAR